MQEEVLARLVHDEWDKSPSRTHLIEDITALVDVKMREVLDLDRRVGELERLASLLREAVSLPEMQPAPPDVGPCLLLVEPAQTCQEGSTTER